jgi:hypothetical protein
MSPAERAAARGDIGRETRTGGPLYADDHETHLRTRSAGPPIGSWLSSSRCTVRLLSREVSGASWRSATTRLRLGAWLPGPQ